MNDNSKNLHYSSTEHNNELKLDKALIKLIMQMQSLPEDVVIGFLKVQGTYKVDNVRKEN